MSQEQQKYIIVLPYPPTVNHYLGRRQGTARPYVTIEGKAYRAQVFHLCRSAEHVPHFDGDVSISIDVFFPDKRRRDLDNLNKLLLDSLVSASVMDDDRQVADLHIRKMGLDPQRKGYVVVELSDYILPENCIDATPDVINKTCPVCGRKFSVSARSNRRCCSPQCTRIHRQNLYVDRTYAEF